MRNIGYVLFAVGLTVLSAGCNSAKAPEQRCANQPPAETISTADLCDQ